MPGDMKPKYLEQFMKRDMVCLSYEEKERVISEGREKEEK